MNAIRLHPSPSLTHPFSPTNPAPPSSLYLDTQIPIPKPSAQNEYLIRVHASTVVRDNLTWPETYHHPYLIPGNDFAGMVISAYDGDNNNVDDDGDDESNGGKSISKASFPRFQIGDQVFGMAHADRSGTWAEYAIVKASEMASKPQNLTWEEAAAVPLSALTAWQALFTHAKIEIPASLLGKQSSSDKPAGGSPSGKSILITGAAGNVGIWLVQLAVLTGWKVVAASSSNVGNGEFLRGLGAHQVVEYGDLAGLPSGFEVVIDSVGGDVLRGCWELVADSGVLVSVDSGSFDFVQSHRQEGGAGKDKSSVRAVWFIVEPNAVDLGRIAAALQGGLLRSFVAAIFPVEEFRKAFELGAVKSHKRGKVVLSM